MSWLDVGSAFYLLEGERLEQESSVEEHPLIFGHVLVEDVMNSCLVGRQLLWWLVANTLGDSDKAGGSLVSVGEVYSWNQPHKDFRFLDTFDESNVSIIDASILDSNPLLHLEFVVLRLVVRVDVGHLLLWQEDVLVKAEVKVLAGLLDVNLLEGFDVNPAFS